jgi:hypothetical protein
MAQCGRLAHFATAMAAPHAVRQQTIRFQAATFSLGREGSACSPAFLQCQIKDVDDDVAVSSCPENRVDAVASRSLNPALPGRGAADRGSAGRPDLKRGRGVAI